MTGASVRMSWYEPGENDGTSAVFVEEHLCPGELGGAEAFRVGAIEDCRAGGAPDQISALITERGRDRYGQQDHPQWNEGIGLGDQNFGGEEEGVTGEEESDEQIRLDENRDEEADQPGCGDEDARVQNPSGQCRCLNRPGFLAAPTLATSPGGVPILDCSRPPRIRLA